MTVIYLYYNCEKRKAVMYDIKECKIQQLIVENNKLKDENNQ